MSVERKEIKKPYLLLCEGRDAEGFLIQYLNSSALAQDQRFSNSVQIFDFGGNDDLCNFQMNLKNMDKFDSVESMSIIRDAEKDYAKACREIKGALQKCGFASPECCGKWIDDDTGLRIGFELFPLNKDVGTLEDLCLRILSEKENVSIQSAVDAFLAEMESSYGRIYPRKHKNKLHAYLSSTNEYVAMPIGVASKARAFDWSNNELETLKNFLVEGFGN